MKTRRGEVLVEWRVALEEILLCIDDLHHKVNKLDTKILILTKKLTNLDLNRSEDEKQAPAPTQVDSPTN